MAFEDFIEEAQVFGRDLVDKVKTLIHEGNVRRIIVKDEHGNTFVEIPVTVAAIGTILASPRRLVAALKPGGILVLEGFAGREKFMLQPNELLRDFSGLRVLRYEDTDDEAEWAPGHQSHIIRFVAEKPK